MRILIHAWPILVLPWLFGCRTPPANQVTNAEDSGRKETLLAVVQAAKVELAEAVRTANAERTQAEQAAKKQRDKAEKAKQNLAAAERAKKIEQCKANQARKDFEKARKSHEELEAKARAKAAQAAEAELDQTRRRKFLRYVIGELSKHEMEIKNVKELAGGGMMKFTAQDKTLTIVSPNGGGAGWLANRRLFQEFIKTIDALEHNDLEVREFTFIPSEPWGVKLCNGNLTIGPSATLSNQIEGSQEQSSAPAAAPTPADPIPIRPPRIRTPPQ